MQTAMEYVEDAVGRLHGMAAMIEEWWEEFMRLTTEHADEMVAEVTRDKLPSDEMVEIATQIAGHIYNMLRMLPVLALGSEETARVLFDYVAAPRIKQQVIIDKLQEATGNPYSVTEFGPVSMFAPETVVVPDDLSELDDGGKPT